MDFKFIKEKLLGDDFQKKVRKNLPEAIDLSAERLKLRMEASISEAEYAWNILSQYDLSRKRILEVGSGVGILTIFLKMQGYDVIGNEPGGIGFAENHFLSQMISDDLGQEYPLLQDSVEDLNSEKYGTFDFIFSINVLEHLPNPDKTLEVLTGLLNPGGKMVHHCPNYHVPYEPHYHVPLVPFFPKAIKPLIAHRFKEEDCWDSLNFVTGTRVKRIAKQLDVEIDFKKGMMLETFNRFETDEQFSQRQKGLIYYLYRFLKVTRLLKLMGLVSPVWATPMQFEIKAKKLAKIENNEETQVSSQSVGAL